jgi:hypothetical protein
VRNSQQVTSRSRTFNLPGWVNFWVKSCPII